MQTETISVNWRPEKMAVYTAELKVLAPLDWSVSDVTEHLGHVKVEDLDPLRVGELTVTDEHEVFIWLHEEEGK